MFFESDNPGYRVAWLLCVLLRLLLVTAPGYLHPSEFFQGPEPIAGDVLGLSHLRAHELSPPLSQNMLLPMALYGIPFSLLRFVLSLKSAAEFGSSPLMPWVLLLLPRVSMFVLSLFGDLAVHRISHRLLLDPMPRVLVFSTSFVVFVLSTRCLTGSIEIGLLALLLLFVIPDSREPQPPSHPVGLGIVTALAVFHRPLFALAALPAWVAAAVMQHRPKRPSGSIKLFLGAVLTFLLTGFALSVADAAVANIFLHPSLPRPATPALQWPWSNQAPSELPYFGLRPNWFAHMFLSLPLLFGPGYFLAFYVTTKLMLGVTFGSRRQLIHVLDLLTPTALPSSSPGARRTCVSVVALYVCGIAMIIGLTTLAQLEIWSLLPLAVPFSVIFGGWFCGRHSLTVLLRLWLFFNIAAGLFFGFYYQAGIVPLLDTLNRHLNPAQTTHVVLAYLPAIPRYPLMRPAATCPSVVFHDLGSAPGRARALAAVLDDLHSLPCAWDTLYVVAPLSIPSSLVQHMALVTRIYPHVSLLYLARSFAARGSIVAADLALGVWVKRRARLFACPATCVASM